MSGPKTARYSLTAEQLRELERQREARRQERLRRLEEERRKSELLMNASQLEQAYDDLLQQTGLTKTDSLATPDENASIGELEAYCSDLQQIHSRTIQNLKEGASRAADELFEHFSKISGAGELRSGREAVESALAAEPLSSREDGLPDYFDRRQATELLAAIGDPYDEDSQQVVSQLQQVIYGHVQLDDQLTGQAEELIQASQQRDVGGRVTEIAQQALADLGFAVDEGFSTVFVEGGIAHIQKSGWGDYYVRLRVNPEEQTMNVNMVRAGNPQERATAEKLRHDTEMEESWCRDHAKFQDELRKRGVQAQLIRHLDPGAVAVQIVTPDTVKGVSSNITSAPRRDLPIRQNLTRKT